MVRFGMWDEILAEPRPSPALKALDQAATCLPGGALAAKNRTAEARHALDELDKVRASLPDEAARA